MKSGLVGSPSESYTASQLLGNLPDRYTATKPFTSESDTPHVARPAASVVGRVGMFGIPNRRSPDHHRISRCTDRARPCVLPWYGAASPPRDCHRLPSPKLPPEPHGRRPMAPEVRPAAARTGSPGERRRRAVGLPYESRSECGEARKGFLGDLRIVMGVLVGAGERERQHASPRS